MVHARQVGGTYIFFFLSYNWSMAVQCIVQAGIDVHLIYGDLAIERQAGDGTRSWHRRSHLSICFNDILIVKNEKRAKGTIMSVHLDGRHVGDVHFSFYQSILSTFLYHMFTLEHWRRRSLSCLHLACRWLKMVNEYR